MSTPCTLLPPALTSVTYTTPASASPRLTLLTTALTSVSWLAGFTVCPAFVNACSVYRPHGTEGAQRTTISPGLARSPRLAMPLGLPAPTTISSRFRAKTWAVPTRLASCSACILGWSAEAKTSPGAPCLTCATRLDDPPKLRSTLTEEWSFSNWPPRSLNAELSEAAASTVTEPLTAPAGCVVPPQAVAVSATATSNGIGRFIPPQPAAPVLRR